MVRLQESSSNGNIAYDSPNTQHSLGGFNETPLVALSEETRRQLSCMLNRKKVLRSEEGYERDWRGIASLAQQRGYVDEYASNPMDVVLTNWCRHNPHTAKFGNLEEYLRTIDRWDVCDDIQENLIKDTDRFNTNQQKAQRMRDDSLTSPVNNNNSSSGSGSNYDSIYTQHLCKDDVDAANSGLPPPTYNACVLYAEADIELATEIMLNLESPRYDFKLFLRHRLLPGVPFEHAQLSQLMATRCNHLIVLFTEEFMKCTDVLSFYLLNFTQALQIKRRERKIIPIVYEHNLKLPDSMDIYTRLYYSANSTLFNFWDKLAMSLQDTDTAAAAAQAIVRQPREEKIIRRVNNNTPPETPRILLNDEDVTDIPDCQLLEATKLKPMVNSPQSSPVLEVKKKKKDKLLQKLTLFGTPAKNGTMNPLRHAISDMNVAERERTLSAGSSSNISTTSESKKNSIKWRPKILKKVFSRSSSKMQIPS